MIDPVIARVLAALSLDPIVEGRVRGFLHRELPRRSGELGLGNRKGKGKNEGRISKTEFSISKETAGRQDACPTSTADGQDARPTSTAPEYLARLVFIPFSGPMACYAIGAAVMLLLTAALALLMGRPSALLALAPIAFLLGRRVVRPLPDEVRLSAGIVYHKGRLCDINAIERVRFARRHLFSAPLALDHPGATLEIPRGAPGLLAVTSQLALRLEGRAVIEPAVKEWLRRAPLPLERALLWARLGRAVMFALAVICTAAAVVIARHGMAFVLALYPLPIFGLLLVPLVMGAVRHEVRMLQFLAAAPMAVLAAVPFLALLLARDAVAAGALGLLAAICFFFAALPAFVARPRLGRLILPAALSAAYLIALALLARAGGFALALPEKVFDYDGYLIRLGVSAQDAAGQPTGGYVFVTAHSPAENRTISIIDDQFVESTVFHWRPPARPQPVVVATHPQLSVPIWLRDMQEATFTAPGLEGFLNLRFIGIPGGEERAHDMLYESPRRLFVGLTPYQLSRDGSHVWLEDKAGAAATRYLVRRVRDSRDLWSAVSAPALVNAPAIAHLNWESGHSALLMHYIMSDEALPGYPPGVTLRRDVVLAVHDFDAGTSAVLARLPEPVLEHRLFRRQGFLLTLTGAHALQFTDLATGESRRHDNPHFIATRSFGTLQWARDEGVLYALASSALQTSDPRDDVPFDHIVRLDPVTGEQRLVWQSATAIRGMWVPPDGRYFFLTMDSPFRLFGYPNYGHYALDAATGEVRRLGSQSLITRSRFTSPDDSLEMPLAEYPRAWLIPQASLRLRPFAAKGAIYRISNPLIFD